MAHIYTQAARVISWPGNYDEYTEAACDGLRALLANHTKQEIVEWMKCEPDGARNLLDWFKKETYSEAWTPILALQITRTGQRYGLSKNSHSPNESLSYGAII